MAKKKVNVELNMTPFIGLFALLVVMLLMTAVWNQISVLSTETSQSNSEGSSDSNGVQLEVSLLEEAIEISENDKAKSIAFIDGKINREAFLSALSEWKQRYPSKSDVILNSANSAPYKHLIEVFDLIVESDFPDVGVNTQ